MRISTGIHVYLILVVLGNWEKYPSWKINPIEMENEPDTSITDVSYELLLSTLVSSDPFTIGTLVTSDKSYLKLASVPYFWHQLWSRMIESTKPELWSQIRAIMGPDEREERLEGVRLNLPERRQTLGEDLADISDDELDSEIEDASLRVVKAWARIVGVYNRIYARKWIRLIYPNLSLPLGNLLEKYRPIVDYWYFSNKGILMHTSFKNPDTPYPRVMIP